MSRAGPPAAGSRRARLRALPRWTLAALRGHDLMLLSAGLTFYAAIGVVPLLLVSTRLASALVGEERVLQLAASMESALPSALGADEQAQELVAFGAGVPWLVVLVCVLPATVYGEGVRRAYRVMAPPVDEPERLTGWRGRLATLPLLAAAPLLLLAVLAITPLLADLFASGIGGGALGVYVALNVDWLVLSVALVWSFRVVAARPVPLRAAVVGGLTTGAFASGFLQGFVLFLSLPIDLGAPFGGATEVGAVTAVLLWLWLLHTVVLVGWVATVTWVESSAAPDDRPLSTSRGTLRP